MYTHACSLSLSLSHDSSAMIVIITPSNRGRERERERARARARVTVGATVGSARPAGTRHTEHDGRSGVRGDSGRGFDHQHGARLKAPGRTPRFTAGRNRSQDRRQCLAAPCAYGEQEKRARQQPQPLLRLHACALQRLPQSTRCSSTTSSVNPLLLNDRCRSARRFRQSNFLLQASRWGVPCRAAWKAGSREDVGTKRARARSR